MKHAFLACLSCLLMGAACLLESHLVLSADGGVSPAGRFAGVIVGLAGIFMVLVAPPFILWSERSYRRQRRLWRRPKE